VSEQVTERSINPLKARLAAGKPAVGLLVSMPSVHVTQVLAASGFDWLFFDMEHGPIGIESAHAMITATSGTPCAPIVRVPWNVPWLVKPVLDAGAMGTIVPMIRSAAEAEQAVRAVRYPPTGERGFGPFYAPARWSASTGLGPRSQPTDQRGLTMQTYADPADREILCILLIEHKDAIDDIEAIVKVPGVDACLIAPFDLAMSYGYRDGPAHAEVQAAIERAERAILNSPVHLGGLAVTSELANAAIARGYRLILIGFDTMLLQRAADEVLNAIDRG
jgi:4-hydroxy-2-oxoheptanedioate aldolase